MSEQNDSIVPKSSRKKWSVVASLYTVLALNFFLCDYLYILLNKYRRGISFGVFLVAGVLSYPLFFIYIIVSICSVPYWIKNRKSDPIRAVIPLLIVIATLILYALYIAFIAPHIADGGFWCYFILYEIERLSS